MLNLAPVMTMWPVKDLEWARDFYATHEALGENHRRAFFAQPEQSVRGWERALGAQRRIDCSETTPGTVAIVSHGAVGALLQCWLAGRPISRQWDQPADGGGNWFGFTLEPRALRSPWQPIDAGG